MGEPNSSNVPPGTPKAGWKLTLEDLFQNDLVRTFRRDFYDLYAFYLDR